MEKLDFISNKIFTQDEIYKQVHRWRLKSKTVVFTNGCFDVFHPGHLHILNESAAFADRLVVGINSDASVKRLKGDTRPIHSENNRARLLASLQQVAAVVLFEEDTPINLIKAVQPDVLVKGGDYTLEQIIGAPEVQAAGGRVEIVGLLAGHSSTNIIEGK